jgi:hypothetical protein
MNKNRKKNKRGKTKQRRIADKVGNYVGRCPGLAISVYVLLQRTTPSMLTIFEPKRPPNKAYKSPLTVPPAGHNGPFQTAFCLTLFTFTRLMFCTTSLDRITGPTENQHRCGFFHLPCNLFEENSGANQNEGGKKLN